MKKVLDAFRDGITLVTALWVLIIVGTFYVIPMQILNSIRSTIRKIF